MTEDANGLRRSLNRFDAVMIVIGTIVGIGIFFQPRATAAAAGSGGLSLVAWLVGSVLAMTGAFTYAALGRMLPHTGGPYVYLREAFGRLPAFLYGWMILVAIGSGATAVVGQILVQHVAFLFDVEPAPLTVSLFAAATVVLLTLVNVAGVQWGSRVQNVATVLKIAALLGLIAAGLSRGEEPISFETSVSDAPTSALTGVAAAMSAVLFSFGGWQNLSNVAGEMKAPEKDFVPAIVIGVSCVAVLYLLANVAILLLLPVPELVASETPVAAALKHAIGDRAADVGAVLIVISAFGIVNGLMLSLPRIYFAMGRDGLLPATFGRVSPRFRTPAVAIFAQAAITAGLCFVQSVGALTEYAVFADWLFFSANALALFALVRSRKVAKVGLGYPLVPAIFAVLAIAVTIGILITGWDNARWGLLLVLAGVIVFAATGRARAAASSVVNAVEDRR